MYVMLACLLSRAGAVPRRPSKRDLIRGNATYDNVQNDTDSNNNIIILLIIKIIVLIITIIQIRVCIQIYIYIYIYTHIGTTGGPKEWGS